MSEGPLFPKKTSEEEQEESPPLVIERSDDPNFGSSTRGTSRRVPRVPGRPAGCSSSMFLMMLVGIGMLAYLVA